MVDHSLRGVGSDLGMMLNRLPSAYLCYERVLIKTYGS